MKFIGLEKRAIGGTDELIKSLDVIACKIKLMGVNKSIPNIMFENIVNQLGVFNKYCEYTSLSKTSKGYYICFTEKNIPKCIFVNSFGFVKFKCIVKDLSSDYAVRHASQMKFKVKNDSLVFSALEQPLISSTDFFERDLFRVCISNSLQLETKGLRLPFRANHIRR